MLRHLLRGCGGSQFALLHTARAHCSSTVSISHTQYCASAPTPLSPGDAAAAAALLLRAVLRSGVDGSAAPLGTTRGGAALPTSLNALRPAFFDAATGAFLTAATSALVTGRTGPILGGAPTGRPRATPGAAAAGGAPLVAATNPLRCGTAFVAIVGRDWLVMRSAVPAPGCAAAVATVTVAALLPGTRPVSPAFVPVALTTIWGCGQVSAPKNTQPISSSHHHQLGRRIHVDWCTASLTGTTRALRRWRAA